jgi:hypothetical protein
MSLARWPLINARPAVQVVLTLAQGGQPLVRDLLADSGAGSLRAAVDLLLEEQDRQVKSMSKSMKQSQCRRSD